MGDDSSVPVFTGAELALADTLILLIKVMAMHGVIDPEAIGMVFSDLENRYRGQNLNSAAAMAEYLRQHAVGEEQDMALLRLRTLLDKAPEGSACFAKKDMRLTLMSLTPHRVKGYSRAVMIEIATIAYRRRRPFRAVSVFDRI
jgi:hypothetical protein